MVADLSVHTGVASLMCDSLVDSFDVGGAAKLRIYDSTRAATTDTALGAQVLLAELTFSATAFGAAASGVATAAAITQDSSADATGTASWFRITNGSGTARADGNVGTSTSDLILNTVSIVSGAVVSISAGSITVPVT